MATIRKRRDKVRGPGRRAASGRLERDAEPAWHDRMATYKSYAEAASAIDKVWRDQVVRDIKDKKAPLERPADAEVPDQPPRPRVIAMDTSTEALQRLLADNPRGLLHVRDELAGWLGSFDRYGGNGADRSFYLECWNGGAYVSDRIKFNGVPLRIKHTSLAILGGIVPDRLRAALADADDGLPARFIFVWPDPVPIALLCECSDADATDRRAKLKAFPVINARVPDVAPQFLSSRDLASGCQ